MSEHSEDRIYPPTPRRRQQARQQGQVARSHDLVVAVILLAALACLYVWGDRVGLYFRQIAQQHWGTAVLPVASTETVVDHARSTLAGLAAIALPVLGCILAAAVLSQLAQTGFLFLPDKIAPDVARLHPGRGWQRLLEGGNGVRSLLGLVKLLTIVAVAAGTLWGDRERLLTTLALAPAPLAATLFQLLLDVGLRVALALAALAVLDYGYQFWRHEQQLWMTRQELQEEQRSEQGDPAIASRRRSLRQTLSLQPLTRRVPEADVVLVRRGALAVALRYDASQSIAPHVVAKGSGAVAAQIEQVALEHGVPIAEEPQLTRDLYRQTPLEAPILPEHYAAVARLLAQRA